MFGSDEDEELFDSNNNIAAEADDEAQLGAQPASQPTARERLEALAGKKRREQVCVCVFVLLGGGVARCMCAQLVE